MLGTLGGDHSVRRCVSVRVDASHFLLPQEVQSVLRLRVFPRFPRYPRQFLREIGHTLRQQQLLIWSHSHLLSGVYLLLHGLGDLGFMSSLYQLRFQGFVIVLVSRLFELGWLDLSLFLLDAAQTLALELLLLGGTFRISILV